VNKRFDVIIVGGGMVGTALACALAREGLSIALLEPRTPEPPGGRIDLRVSALSMASHYMLDALGVWADIPAQRCHPYDQMRVWDGEGAIHFDSAELGHAQLGWIAENKAVHYALWQRASTQANITLLCPARLDTFSQTSDGSLRVDLEDGLRLRAQLIVGADGGGSKVRQLAGITTAGRDYHQQALVTTVRTEHPHADTAWQRFLPSGPLAFLPLADGQCAIVWSHHSEEARVLAQLDDTTLGQQLTDAFAGRLGEVTVTGPRGTFPLRMQYAQHYVQPGIALVGDAAHIVHPLAGQGVNLGFLDVAALAQVLGQATQRRRPLAALTTLRRYERWRRGENRLMLQAMDSIERLFGNTLPPLAWLRATGLSLTDRLTSVKQLLARQAMGLNGDLPELARPTLFRNTPM